MTKWELVEESRRQFREAWERWRRETIQRLRAQLEIDEGWRRAFRGAQGGPKE